MCTSVPTIIAKKQFPKLNSRPMPQKGVHVWNIGFIRTYKHIRKMMRKKLYSFFSSGSPMWPRLASNWPIHLPLSSTPILGIKHHAPYSPFLIEKSALTKQKHKLIQSHQHHSSCVSLSVFAIPALLNLPRLHSCLRAQSIPG